MMDIPLLMLRWAVPVTACGLLVSAVVAVLREGLVTEAAGGVLLGLLYAAGQALVGRRIAGPVWLLMMTAGWVVLAVAASPFVWLAFPLLFSYLNVLPLWAAMFGVTVLTSAVILVAAWHAGELTLPLVVGPGVAAVMITLLALACQALHEEAARELE
ncbi:hypothetical protein ITP53_46425 [Nonomuraea sp. K274]|uniref:Uncharacterized protein n=1 Tax=Nonomuraea cypriaca TaxID=1187855 RepID=A0A931AHC2_9ACTN|nr:hypothetical protein [Nonomuraea cypriaca]MBF8192987.1 hypothetical protein [Nonomuraea cypriaca]